MKKLSPSEAFTKRMEDAYNKLKKIAAAKVNGKNATNIYWQIGSILNISGTTVANYAQGNTKNGNGYLIDSLITEFEKIPD